MCFCVCMGMHIYTLVHVCGHMFVYTCMRACLFRFKSENMDVFYHTVMMIQYVLSRVQQHVYTVHEQYI